ncbi:MAG TPA: hypothetical protein VFK80_06670, partial [Limnochordia bacterium]|nr:hypothetical protein [Limnochordia bacterium]
MTHALHGAVWLERAIREALAEDVGRGDLTTEALVPPGLIAHARIVAKAPGRICGTEIAQI